MADVSTIQTLRVKNIAKYNPSLNEVTPTKRKKMAGLEWMRWQTNTHRDEDLLDLPWQQRWLWAVLIGLSGVKGSRIHMSVKQIAREADMPVKVVDEALAFLVSRQRVIVLNGESESRS